MTVLLRLLSDWKADLIGRALVSLIDARLPHYAREAEAELHLRMENLLEQVSACLTRRCADPAVEHAARIAQERFSSGYQLVEIQTSINVLEEVLWQRILGSLAPEEAVGALGRISAVIGIIKDTLAQSYLELALDSGISAKW